MALAPIRVPILFRQVTAPGVNLDGALPDGASTDDSYRRRVFSACAAHAGMFEFPAGWIRNVLSLRLDAPGATGYSIQVENDAGRRFTYESATGLAGVSIVRCNMQFVIMEGDRIVVTTTGIAPVDTEGAVCEVYADLLGQSQVPY